MADEPWKDFAAQSPAPATQANDGPWSDFQPPSAAAPPAPKIAQPKRTWAEAAEDTARGVASGIGGVLKSGGQLYGLATGDMDNWATRHGQRTQEYWEEGQSEALKADKAARADAIKQSDGVVGQAGTAIWETVTNPRLLVDTLATNAATLIPAAGAARVGSAVAGARALARGAQATEAARRAAQVGTAAAIGTAAAQQGADVAGGAYEEALQLDDETWAANPEYQQRIRAGEAPAQAKHEIALRAGRVTFPGAAGISLLTQALPGGATIERALAGAAARAGARSGIVGRGINAARGAAGEGVQEALEEGGGQTVANLAQQQIDPNRSLGEGVGEAAGLGFVGGAGLGGVAGAIQRPVLPQSQVGAAEAPPAAAAAPPVVQQPMLALPAPRIIVRPDGRAVSETRIAERDRNLGEQDAAFAGQRADMGLTPDVNRARAAHPAAAPNALAAQQTRAQAAALRATAQGPLTRAAADALDQDANAIEAGMPTAAEQQAIEQAGAAAPPEPQADDLPPPPAPWIDATTGEMGEPTDQQLRQFIHDSVNAMSGNKIRRDVVERNLWNLGVTRERTAEAWKRVVQERKTGLTAPAAEAAPAAPARAPDMFSRMLEERRRDVEQPASEGPQAAGQREAMNAAYEDRDVSVYDESVEALDSDIGAPSGGPFTIEDAAQRVAARTEGGRVFPVDGGFVVRTPRTAPQDESSAPPSGDRRAPSPVATNSAPASAEGPADVVPAAEAGETPQPPAPPSLRAETSSASTSPPVLDTPPASAATAQEGAGNPPASQVAPAAAAPQPEPGQSQPPAAPSDGDPSLEATPAESDVQAAALAALPADANGIVKTRDVYGRTVRVRKADIDGGRALLPLVDAKGQRKPGLGKAIHRDNLDPDGSKQRTGPGMPYYARTTRTGEQPFKTERAAQQAVARAGQPLENYEIRSQGEGFIAVRKPESERAAPALAAAAAQAATSPENDLPEPTEAQKEAGNYRKGHARVAGLDVSIENPAGTRRRPEWPPLKNHYGYFKGTVGKDKDHVDVFMTDRAGDESLPVFVVDQNNRDGSFDEHKVIMGAADEAEARATYLQNYSKGWTGLGAITQMTLDEFKAWVRDPAKTKRRAAPRAAQATAPAAGKPGRSPSREGESDAIGARNRALLEKAESTTLPGRQARGVPAAQVDVAQDDDGRWRVRYSVNSGSAGSASPFNHSEAFDTADEARAAGLREILNHLPTKNLGKGEQAEIERIRAWVAGQLPADTPPPGEPTDDAAPEEPASVEAPPTAYEPAPGPLENFGEALPPPRRNRGASLDEELTDDQIAAQPLSKTWPASEIDGIEDITTAAIAFAARAAIPRKPSKSYKLRRWVEAVQTLRNMVRNITDGTQTPEALLQRAREQSRGLEGFAAKVALLTTVDRDQWSRIGEVREYPTAYRYKAGGGQELTPFVVVEIDGRGHNFDGATSVADVVERVPALLGGSAPSPKAMAFEIRLDRKAGRYFINKKGDKEYRPLKTFEELPAARAYLRANNSELAAAWEKVKERDNVTKADMRSAENRPRTAKDHREGRDATPAMFEEAFGFRGVEFGNWVSQGKGAKERQGLMNEVYDGLLDLAEIVGVPSRAISLNGTLGLALGSRGAGWASAHFEPSNLVINLTKTRGAGSLAHEWFHALDNYFARRRGGEVTFKGNQRAYRESNFITYRPEPMLVHRQHGGTRMTKVELERRRQQHPTAGIYRAENWIVDPSHPQGVRPEVEEAFADLVNTLNESPMAVRARRNDKGPDGYWSQIIERGARAFENYVIGKMAQKGYHNDFLSNVTAPEDFRRDLDRYPYLLPEELAPVEQAFDSLFGVIQSREAEDGRVELFARPDRPQRSEMVALEQLSEGRPNQPLTLAQLQAAVAPVIRGWSGRTRPPVVLLESAADQRAPAGIGDSEGSYDPATGTVYLVASNLRAGFDRTLKRRVTAAERAQMVLAHEVIGHYGIESITGPEMWGQIEATLQRMRASGRHAELFNEIDRRYRGANRSIATREAVAVLVEKGVKNSVVDRVLAAIRRFLRRMGFVHRLSEGELRQHAIAAARFVRDGARPRAQGMVGGEGAFASRPMLDLDKAVPVTQILTGTFGDTSTPERRRVAQRRAHAYLDRLRKAGKTFTNADTGWNIGLSHRSTREIVSWSADPAVIHLIAALPRLTKVAVLANSEVNNDIVTVADAVRAYHTFYAPVALGGTPRMARIVVREHVNGRFAYDLQASDILESANPAEAGFVVEGPARSPAPKAGARQGLPTSMTVAQIRDIVNAVDRPGWFMSARAGTFYSAMAEALASAKGAPKRGDAAAWKGWLDGAQRRGEFKQGERDWLGVDAWLDGRGTTTREELVEFVRANQVQVQDVVLGAKGGIGAIQEAFSREGYGIDLDGMAAEVEELGATYTDPAGDEIDFGDLPESLQRVINENSDNGGGREGEAKFGKYTLPGGQNYRELLLTLPPSAASATSDDVAVRMFDKAYADLDEIERAMVDNEIENVPEGQGANVPLSVFRSSHFDHPNILAHVRFNERTDAEGRRVLFLEEIQSDWHQQGRKRGYGKKWVVRYGNAQTDSPTAVYGSEAEARAKTAELNAEIPDDNYGYEYSEEVATPNAPFKGTDEWAMLAFKRMVRWAAERGFDRVAWTTGEQQAERYDLGKQVKSITAEWADGKYEIEATTNQGQGTRIGEYSNDGLAEAVGRDLAEKITREVTSKNRGPVEYSGMDLKVGGEGMRAFYDKILPAAVNKWAKRFGGRVGETVIGAHTNDLASDPAKWPELPWPKVHSLDVTEAMRDAVLAGQPLFSRPDRAPDVIDEIEQVMSADADQSVLDRARARLAELVPSKLKEQLRPTWLGALTTRHLTELGTDYFGTMRIYSDLLAEMQADRNKLQTEGEAVAEPARKWAAKHPEEAKRLFKLMHDATIAGTDPAEAYQPLQFQYGGLLREATRKNVKEALESIKEQMRGRGGDNKTDMIARAKFIRAMPARERARKQAHPALVARWNALPPQAQEIYRQFRDMYESRSKAIEDALVDRINDTDAPENHKRKMISQIRQQFESQRLQGVYFPLQRFGRYFVSAEKGDTSTFLMFERQAELDRAVKDLRARGFTIKAQGLKGAGKAKDAPSGTFVAEVIETMRKAGVSEKTQDEIYQLYLEALPELSMRKHFIHRQSVPGFDPDAVRAFAFNMHHGAHQIARLRRAHLLADTIAVLKGNQDAARKDPNADTRRIVAGDAILGELDRRHEWIMNPQDSAATNLVSSFGFIYYLGLTPAAALVNLSQTAIISFPYLAARYGALKASTHLLSAMRDSARTLGHIQTKLANDDERRAHEALQKMGALDKTQAHNLAGIAEGGLAGYNPKWAKAMEIIGWGFHKTEVVNREATGIAAYRLAREAGETHERAVRIAADTINDTHYDYTNQNRARFMQSGTAKVLLMFRQYSLNTTWHLARMVWNATKGVDPEVKRIARRNLAGVLGMSAVFSGAMGLPTMSVVMGVLNAVQAMFGDDDEPWEAKTEFRAFLIDMMGDDAASVILDGPVNQVTGADIASRVSMSQLWFRDADRELDGRGAYYNLLEQAAGPMGGVLKNALVGKQMLEEGRYWRGIETMLPKSVKDAMKAVRYKAEGVNNLRGDPILADPSPFQAVLQLNGFTPAEVAEQYDVNSALKNYEQDILDRRQALMDSLAMAIRLGDVETRDKALERIRAFNEKNPEIAINRGSIQRSLRSRARYSATAENGIFLNPKIARRVREAVGAEG